MHTPVVFSQATSTSEGSVASVLPSQSLSWPSHVSEATFAPVGQTIPVPAALQAVTPPAQTPTPQAFPAPVITAAFASVTVKSSSVLPSQSLSFASHASSVPAW